MHTSLLLLGILLALVAPSWEVVPGKRTKPAKIIQSQSVYQASEVIQCGTVQKPGWTILPLPPGAKQRFNVSVPNIYVSRTPIAWTCTLASGRVQLANPVPLTLDLRGGKLTYNVSVRGVGSMHFEQPGLSLILSDPSKARGERAFYKTPVLNFTLQKDGILTVARLPILSDPTFVGPFQSLEIPKTLRNISLGYHVSDILRVELIGDEHTTADVSLRRDALLIRPWRGPWKIVSNRTTAILIDDGVSWDTGVSYAELCKKPPKKIWARISQLPSIKAPPRLAHASIDSINCKGNFSFVATVDAIGAWTRNVKFVDARLDKLANSVMSSPIQSGSATLNSKTDTWTLTLHLPTNYTVAQESNGELFVGKKQDVMKLVYVSSPTQELMTFSPPNAISLTGGPPVQPKDKLSSHFPGVVKTHTHATLTEYSRLDSSFLSPIFSKMLQHLGTDAVVFRDLFDEASKKQLGVSHLTMVFNLTKTKTIVDLYANSLLGNLLFSLDFAFEFVNKWTLIEALGHYSIPGTSGYLGYVSVNFIDRACTGNHPAVFDLSGVPEKPMLNPLTDEPDVFAS